MRYVALLRGINVSGQKLIKMADLKLVFEQCGFLHVATYIQSGNVVFTAGRESVSALTGTIEKAITNRYNFDVPVVLLTAAQLSEAVNNNPLLLQNPSTDTANLYLAFFSGKPKAQEDVLNHFLAKDDRIKLEKGCLHFSCPGGYGKSKLNNNVIEKKLGITATTRNYKTAATLLLMLKENH